MHSIAILRVHIQIYSNLFARLTITIKIMDKTIIAIHILNTIVGIFSIAILTLVARSVILSNGLPPNTYPENAKGTGCGLLFWPGVGGIVDMLLFMFVWYMAPSTSSHVS